MGGGEGVRWVEDDVDGTEWGQRHITPVGQVCALQWTYRGSKVAKKVLNHRGPCFPPEGLWVPNEPIEMGSFKMGTRLREQLSGEADPDTQRGIDTPRRTMVRIFPRKNIEPSDGTASRKTEMAAFFY